MAERLARSPLLDETKRSDGALVSLLRCICGQLWQRERWSDGNSSGRLKQSRRPRSAHSAGHASEVFANSAISHPRAGPDIPHRLMLAASAPGAIMAVSHERAAMGKHAEIVKFEAAVDKAAAALGGRHK